MQGHYKGLAGRGQLVNISETLPPPNPRLALGSLSCLEPSSSPAPSEGSWCHLPPSGVATRSSDTDGARKASPQSFSLASPSFTTAEPLASSQEGGERDAELGRAVQPPEQKHAKCCHLGISNAGKISKAGFSFPKTMSRQCADVNSKARVTGFKY